MEWFLTIAARPNRPAAPVVWKGMSGQVGWRRVAVAAVIAVTAATAVPIPRGEVPAWPRRSARWVARDAVGGWEEPPYVHGPQAVGGRVLAVGGGMPPGRVGAYDAGTGRPRWRYRTGRGLVLLAASARAVVVGSDRGEVDGLDPASGRRRWRLRLARAQGADAAALAGDRLVVATSFPGEGDLRPPVVYALHACTGRRRWRTVLRRGTDLQWARPVLADGLVLVASTPSDPGSAPGHTLHALDAATGRLRWELALRSSEPGFHAERPLLHRGLVIVPAGGALLAVDPGSGREVWRRRGPGLPQLVGATGWLVLAVAAGGRVVVAARAGELLGYAP